MVAATRTFAAAGLPTRVEDGTTCCYALQDKVWVTGAGNDWEVYTVLADAGAELEGKTLLDITARPSAHGGGCCGTDTKTVAAADDVTAGASASVCC